MRAALTVAGASLALFGCASGHHGMGRNRGQFDAGRSVFVHAGCGGCHTLAAAGTHGTLGPDFDRSEKLSASQIREQLHAGVGGMPSFSGRLTPEQEMAVATFLSAAMARTR